MSSTDDPVAPEARVLLDAWAATPSPSIDERTPETVRASDRDVQQYQPDPEPVGARDTITIGADDGPLELRVFQPRHDRATSEPLPVLLYVHGGGFVIGSESYESPIRALCNRSGRVVVVPEYRLAPEHPYPAAERDAWAAAEWVNARAQQVGGSVERVAVAGDSSGGTLAARVAIRSQHTTSVDVERLLLVYPMLDATVSQPSTRTFGEGFGFTREKIEWYFRQYLTDDVDRADPRVSPFFETNLGGLPPTFIATAACDPLRDEAEAFGRSIRQAGGDVHVKRYSGMIHGFLQMADALPAAHELIADLTLQLQR